MNFFQNDGQCFQGFINLLSEKFSDSINFLQLNNRSFHQKVNFQEFRILIFSPPHSRELNLIENFWQQLKGELQFQFIAKTFDNYKTYAKKPGFDSKSLFLTHKYLGETGFGEFAFVSPDIVNLLDLLMQIKYTPSIGVNSPYPYQIQPLVGKSCW